MATTGTFADGVHASRHAAGGADPVTPGAIAAVEASAVGAAGGVASLDSDGLVAQVPQVGSLLGNWTVFLGDSITARGAQIPDIGWRGSGFATYGPIISSQRIQYVRNAGVPGDTTADMLARFDTDVTPYEPNVVVILGGTNDTGQSVSIGTIQANIAGLIAKTRVIGANPVLCTVPPNGSGTPSDRKTRITALNSWIRRYAARHGIPLIDFYSLLVDPSSGGYLAGYDSGDHTHPSNAGDYAMGKLLADTLGPQLPSYVPLLPADANDPNNFLRNALFLDGTDANGIPDQWLNQNGVTGQTVSLVTNDDAIKGNWIKYVTANSSGSSILFQTVTANPAGNIVTAGNRYAFLGRVKASTLTAGSLLTQMRFQGGVTTDFRAMDTLDQPILTGGVFYVEGTAPAGSTSVQAQVQITAGTGDAQFAQIGIFDLTAMGVL